MLGFLRQCCSIVLSIIRVNQTMKSLLRRDILQKGRLARRAVASAITLTADEDDDRYSNIALVLARANQFGSLPFALVRRSKDADARSSDEREFLSRMGKWMVERPGQTYMEQLVIPILQADENAELTAIFPWTQEVEGVDDAVKSKASRFLELGDSPILDAMVSLKSASVNAVDEQDILPISYLQETDVKLAHHSFLIDFFFEMLPNLLVNSSSSATQFESLTDEINAMYENYNGFVHAIAKTLVEKQPMAPFIFADSEESKATAALEVVIKNLTGMDVTELSDKKDPFFGLQIEDYRETEMNTQLQIILDSVASVLGVQIVASIIFHLRIFADSTVVNNSSKKKNQPFKEKHLIHLLRWVNFLYPEYIIKSKEALVQNTNLAEHDAAISRLGTLMEALKSRETQVQKLQEKLNPPKKK